MSDYEILYQLKENLIIRLFQGVKEKPKEQEITK
tara:strand:+ start:4766 stop:4867 length:102 start_codon:yes stop_codon:yes gene_type:complete